MKFSTAFALFAAALLPGALAAGPSARGAPALPAVPPPRSSELAPRSFPPLPPPPAGQFWTWPTGCYPQSVPTNMICSIVQNCTYTGAAVVAQFPGTSCDTWYPRWCGCFDDPSTNFYPGSDPSNALFGVSDSYWTFVGCAAPDAGCPSKPDGTAPLATYHGKTDKNAECPAGQEGLWCGYKLT